MTLQPDEFELTARARAGHEVAEDGDLLVALDTTVDDELAAEGLAREVAHRLQALRKAAGYEISDRIAVAMAGSTGGAGDARRAPRLAGGRGAGDRAGDRRRMRPSQTPSGPSRPTSTASGWTSPCAAPATRSVG